MEPAPFLGTAEKAVITHTCRDSYLYRFVPVPRRKRGGSPTGPGRVFLAAQPLHPSRDPLFQIGNLNPDRKGPQTICPTRPDRALWKAEHEAWGTQWMWARCRLTGPPPRSGIGAGEPDNPSTRVPNRSPSATCSTGTKAMHWLTSPEHEGRIRTTY